MFKMVLVVVMSIGFACAAAYAEDMAPAVESAVQDQNDIIPETIKKFGFSKKELLLHQKIAENKAKFIFSNWLTETDKDTVTFIVEGDTVTATFKGSDSSSVEKAEKK